MNALEIQQRLLATLRGDRQAFEELKEEGALETMLRRRRLQGVGEEPAPPEIALPTDPPKTNRQARAKLAAKALAKYRER